MIIIAIVIIIKSNIFIVYPVAIAIDGGDILLNLSDFSQYLILQWIEPR